MYGNRTSWLEQMLRVHQMRPPIVATMLRHKNLLHPEMKCSVCVEPMVERLRNSTADQTVWTCRTAGCSKYGSTCSIRTGSFFAAFRLSLADVWTVVILWVQGKSVGDVAADYGIDRGTVGRIFKRLQAIVVAYMEVEPVRLGGPGIICQVDESLFVHKQKYHVGRVAETERWVFGIVDTSFSPSKGYMVEVPDRTAETMFPIMQRVIRPGSIIHSDRWKAYARIQEKLGFAHQSVNHSLNFVDPKTGAHTQNIESYWNKQKDVIKEMKGIGADELPAFLGEATWRDNFREKAFFHLVGLLRAE